jgi:hypothetical protein
MVCGGRTGLLFRTDPDHVDLTQRQSRTRVAGDAQVKQLQRVRSFGCVHGASERSETFRLLHGSLRKDHLP